MSDDETLSQLIGQIYDAAIEPAAWEVALKQTASFVGGCAAAVYSSLPLAREGILHHTCGTADPKWHQLYFQRYVKLNPGLAGLMTAPVGEPMGTADYLPYDEFVETRFYKEWARPQGFVDIVTTSLDKTPTTVATATVFRHERDGMTDDGARHRKRLLVPHLQRAVLIARLLDESAARAVSLTEACDGLAAGMFMLAADARIMHMNASAQAMVTEGALLTAVGGRLVPTDRPAVKSFRDILMRASTGDTAVGAQGIAIPVRNRTGEPHVMHLLPLTSGARRRAGGKFGAVGALFVRQADGHGPTPTEAIANLYKLTPAELRVLVSIVQLAGVQETAEVLGISHSTVKTHLNRLYAKTGSNRHADLVKLVARLSSPLT